MNTKIQYDHFKQHESIFSHIAARMSELSKNNHFKKYRDSHIKTFQKLCQQTAAENSDEAMEAANIKPRPHATGWMMSPDRFTQKELEACGFVTLAVIHDAMSIYSPNILPKDRVYQHLWNTIHLFFAKVSKIGILNEYLSHFEQALLGSQGNKTLTDKPEDKTAPQGQLWSKPMSKSQMMAAFRIDSLDRFNTFANSCGIKYIRHKSYQLCMDKLSPQEREKLEKA